VEGNCVPTFEREAFQMHAGELAEQVPVVTRTTSGAEAIRMMAEYRLSGLVVEDDRGVPVAVIPGSQLLGLVVPDYITESPNLAHVLDEHDADAMCLGLNDVTLGELLDRQRLTQLKLPTVLPDDTLVEIADVMLRGHYPLICVREANGRYLGVVTMSRIMAAIAKMAGQDSALVQRRLERDIIERGKPWPLDPADDVEGNHS
jgi:CBS domain-containing protein